MVLSQVAIFSMVLDLVVICSGTLHVGQILLFSP